MGEERGAPGPVTPVFAIVARRRGSAPALNGQLLRDTEYGVNPCELLPVSKLARWTLAEVFRGRPRLVLDLLADGRRIAGVQAELREWRRMLEAVDGLACRQFSDLPLPDPGLPFNENCPTKFAADHWQ